jgi:Uma2 family endonuclease
MKATAPQLKISIADYLEGELISDVKYEYVNGEVFAMAGVSEQHNTITVNLTALLRQHLRGTGCKVFVADMKTRIQFADENYFYYPDLQVCCQSSDKQRYYKEAPKLVIEVLSSSTERYDRSEKFDHYRQLPSLEEYILVAQNKQKIEIYRRNHHWQPDIYTENEVFQFQSVDLSLSMAAVYEDVEF